MTGGRRTPGQQRADKFDLDLFRLIMNAEAEPLSPQWQKIGETLREARALVRTMMHDDDRWATRANTGEPE